MFGGPPQLSQDEKEFNRKLVQLTCLQVLITATLIAIGTSTPVVSLFLILAFSSCGRRLVLSSWLMMYVKSTR